MKNKRRNISLLRGYLLLVITIKQHSALSTVELSMTKKSKFYLNAFKNSCEYKLRIGKWQVTIL